MWHGEPTWSFLWRKVARPVLDAGHRVVLPDLAGFGRSDKPMDIGWYSYDQHVAIAATLLEDLDIRGATFVVHDWGGPIGLRLAVEHPERVDRLVVMDSGLITGRQKMSDDVARVRATSSPAPRTCRSACSCARGCHTDPGDEVIAAYDAPFPNAASKAAARAFPELLMAGPDTPGAVAGRRVLAALKEDKRPLLILWGAEDPVLPPSAGERFASALGREIAAGGRGRRALPAGRPRRRGRRPDRGVAGA